MYRKSQRNNKEHSSGSTRGHIIYGTSADSILHKRRTTLTRNTQRQPHTKSAEIKFLDGHICGRLFILSTHINLYMPKRIAHQLNNTLGQYVKL